MFRRFNALSFILGWIFGSAVIPIVALLLDELIKLKKI